MKLLLQSILIIFLVGCGDDSGSGATKNVLGKIGSSYTKSPKRASSLDGTNKPNEVWVATLSRTKPIAGADRVTLNYGGIINDLQKFPINADGSFDINVEEKCQSNSYTDCLGYVIMLVDSTQENMHDQIKSFLSLSGSNSLVALPLEDLKENTALNFGTLTDSNITDEDSNTTIEEAADKFATLSSNDLTEIAATDDYAKIVKNVLINPGTFMDPSNFHLIHENLKNDEFSTIEDIKEKGLEIPIQFTNYSGGPDLNITDDGSITYTLTPPSQFTYSSWDINYTVDNFTFSTPIFNNEFRFGGTYMVIGRDNVKFAVDDGYWILRNDINDILGAFDLSVGYPLNKDKKFTKTLIPKVKPVTNAEGKVYKVIFEWFKYDGSSYVKVDNLSHFLKNSSKFIVYIEGNTVDGNYISVVKRYLGETTMNEIVLDEPLDITRIMLSYGYYVGEINLEYYY